MSNIAPTAAAGNGPREEAKGKAKAKAAPGRKGVGNKAKARPHLHSLRKQHLIQPQWER